MKVLIINGHPRGSSYCESLAESYRNGAAAAGHEVHLIHLYQLTFNLNVIQRSPRDQPFEAGLTECRELILWSDHMVFFYPTWWGTMPAMLKGFIDRVFTEGFAFNDIEGGTGYEPLLEGKSASLFTTMDTPSFVYKLVYRSPGNNAMRFATLGFCGINPVKCHRYGAVRGSGEMKRKQWIDDVFLKGKNLPFSAVNTWDRIKMKILNWLKAIRLQFYPMTFVAYWCGALAAQSLGYDYSLTIFWIGYLWIFLVEVATVLSNDYFDFKTDANNKLFSPFTGGSRVLVENKLKFSEVKIGIITAIALSLIPGAMLFFVSPANSDLLLTACLLTFIPALGYTIPPLKFCYRGLGELTVGYTHSFAVIICGFVFQGGHFYQSFPWLLSIPLFLSVIPSITLAGIPDMEADKQAGKRTLSVLTGRKGAAGIALFFTILSMVIAGIYMIKEVNGGAFDNLLWFVIPHGSWLSWKIIKFIKAPASPARIDGLLVIALSYLVWFGLIPLINLY